MHALVSDPGGEPSARHIAHDSAAFQFPETVGFHSRTSGSYLNDHGSDISRLYAQRKCPWGIHAPLIISGPGVAYQGETVENLAHIMDLTPTFMDLAKTTYPARYDGKPVEQPLGKSMVSFLSKENPTVHDKDEALGWEYNDLTAIRVGDYKATWTSEPFGENNWQVFNLSVDPGEANDLSSEEPELKLNLINAWKKYAEAVGVVPLEDTSQANK